MYPQKSHLLIQPEKTKELKDMGSSELRTEVRSVQERAEPGRRCGANLSGSKSLKPHKTKSELILR